MFARMVSCVSPSVPWVPPQPGEEFYPPMASVRRIRRKTDNVAASATVVRLPGQSAAAKDVVRSFASAVGREFDAKRVAGLPYSTLNVRGEVVFVHPDGTVRTGRASDSPAVSWVLPGSGSSPGLTVPENPPWCAPAH
jgi:hypothetical protein